MASILLPLLCAAAVIAQQSRDDIVRTLERQPCAESSGGKVCQYDYVVADAHVEAISFVPVGAGPFPAVLLIPGFGRTARDLVLLGTELAKVGAPTRDALVH